MTGKESQNSVLLSHKGALDSHSISGLLTRLEEFIITDSFALNKKRELIEISTELLQNVYHHALIENSIGPFFTVEKSEKGFIISTTNMINGDLIPSMQSQIEYLNRMNAEELTDHYRNVLKNDNKVGETVGLGWITIRRKSSNPISYKFSNQGNNFTLFTVSAFVN